MTAKACLGRDATGRLLWRVDRCFPERAACLVGSSSWQLSGWEGCFVRTVHWLARSGLRRPRARPLRARAHRARCGPGSVLGRWAPDPAASWGVPGGLSAGLEEVCAGAARSGGWPWASVGQRRLREQGSCGDGFCAITAHGVRGYPVGADSVPAELYREDKAGGSAARTSGLQKAGWKTVCRRERASEELTLPLRPAVEGHAQQREQKLPASGAAMGLRSG
ncbi:uncharacterized protein LOC122432920 [Cervus canadensis]|uniref:uncharacterized protein LOC122432920 n=1 Tax=Cervus canadensis TaxID=1574408 RepID=UPI001CA36F70|nr:uncharacterized protein LOC122432920 [Cervus canadensis]